MRTQHTATHFRLLLTLFVLACGAPALGADLIPWAPNLEVAREQAARGNRMVLLHFWTTTCAPCRSLEQNVFSDQRVATAIGQMFVPVKIDAERFPDLVKQYGVKSWPTDVIISPSGHVIAKAGCPQSAEGYLSQLGQLAANGGMAAQELLLAAKNAQQTNFGFGANLPNPFGASGVPNGAPFQPPTNAISDRATAAAPEVAPVSAPNGGGTWGGGSAANTASNPPPAWNPTPAGQWADPAARYANQPPASPPTVGEGGTNTNPGWGSPASSNGGQSPPYARGQTNTLPIDVPRMPTRDSGQQWADQRQSPFPTDSALGAAAAGGVVGGSARPGAPGMGTPGFAPGIPSANTANWQAPPSGGAPSLPASPAAGGSFVMQTMGPPQGIPTPQGGMMVTNPNTGAPASTKSAVPQIPPGNPPLAMEGFCPVTLRKSAQWKVGDPQFGAIHRGRTFLFTSAAEQQQFLASPDDFSPMLSGIDAVRFSETGERVEGNRSHGVVYRGQIYLFADEGSLQRFWGAPDRYAAVVKQAMQSSSAQRR